MYSGIWGRFATTFTSIVRGFNKRTTIKHQLPPQYTASVITCLVGIPRFLPPPLQIALIPQPIIHTCQPFEMRRLVPPQPLLRYVDQCVQVGFNMIVLRHHCGGRIAPQNSTISFRLWSLSAKALALGRSQYLHLQSMLYILRSFAWRFSRGSQVEQ